MAQLIGELSKAGIEGPAFPFSSAKHIAWYQLIQVKNHGPWSVNRGWCLAVLGLEELLEAATSGIQGNQVHQQVAEYHWLVPITCIKLGTLEAWPKATSMAVFQELLSGLPLVVTGCIFWQALLFDFFQYGMQSCLAVIGQLGLEVLQLGQLLPLGRRRRSWVGSDWSYQGVLAT